MKVHNCRLCHGKLSEPKINLGNTPLANEFVKEKKIQDLFPLEVCVCNKCEHYQLNEQVDPERLFRHYLFVAGTSKVNVEHFRQYALHMTDLLNLKSGSKILDIASNDGTLLQHFKNLNMNVLGIDPAKNIAEIANKNGIETISEFFTESYADEMLKKYGTFDLITANNVFAHIPDMIGFTKGVKKILSSEGVFSFEVSYFGDVCDRVLFDTVYQEHTSYHTISPLINFFESHDLQLFDVEHIDTHGGSIRVFVKHFNSLNIHYSDRVKLFLEKENNIASRAQNLQNNIIKLGYELNNKLKTLKDNNKSIAIYGFPAKATTLMYALKIDEKMIDFVVDDAPLKQNTFTPGKHIPVLPVSAIYEQNPDVLLVLAWNFSESIIKNHAKYKGQWIVPLPEIKEI